MFLLQRPDGQLCFKKKKKNTNELTKSLKVKLTFFHRNKACITQNGRKQIVQSTFLSVIEYGVIHMHSPASTLNPLMQSINTPLGS